MSTFTLTQVIQHYLQFVRANRSAKTFEGYNHILTNASNYMGELPAESIRKFNATQWLASNASWGNGGRFTAISAIQACLNWAVGEELIGNNPLHKKLKKPQQHSRGEEAYLTLEERTLALAVSPADFRDSLEMMFLTGCRPQAIQLAEASNYNEQSQALIFTEHKTKQHKERLEVLLCTRALAIVVPLVEKYPTGKLFRRASGAPWSNTSMVQRTRTIRHRGTFTKSIICMAGRHTFATDGLISTGNDILIGALLGHKGTAMINHHYSHVNAQHQAKAKALAQFRN
jgi:site-specific recombinase XerD